ncbi:MAG: hypothetical protein B7Z37_03130 [Verrucomicrobia bacterium 12-59-8]|nr:MAG: hypothetical protein B7Z37_03130 [Verrucomicrobia bacterium 12-59-8]
MAIQGLRDSSNFATNERPENWRETLLRLMPVSAKAAKAPLTALTAAMKEESTNDSVFHWWEKGVQSRRVALGANLTAPAAGTVQTLTIVSGALSYKAGDIFMVENGLQSGAACELMQVHQDPTADTSLTVVRGVAGSTPATLAYAGAGINPYIVCIGNAYEEGSLAPTGVSWNPSDQYNYTQIFRNTFELTRTAMKTKLRTNPKAYDEAKRETMEVMGMDMERAFLFGRLATGSKNGKPIRYTAGIYHQLAAANKIAVTNATLKMTQWDSIMQSIFAEGSSEKIMMGGNQALAAIQTCVRKNTSYQIYLNEKEYGMKVTKFTCPFGDLTFWSHPLFNQMPSGTTAATAYYSLGAAAFVLDMENIKYRYLDGSDIHFEDELEEPGMDGVKEGFIGECGLEVDHLSTHFFIYNMASGAADL